MPTMVDMRLPKPNKKRSIRVASEMEAYPKYPWGMTVNLNSDSLKKLKKTVGDFRVGDIKTIVAQVKVTSVSKSESETGNDHQEVGLQITKMQFMKK